MEFIKEKLYPKEPEVQKTWTCLLLEQLNFQNINIAILSFGLICLMVQIYRAIRDREGPFSACVNPFYYRFISPHLVVREIKLLLVVSLFHVYLLMWFKAINGKITICIPYIVCQFLILILEQIFEAMEPSFERNARYTFNACMVWLIFVLNVSYLIWTLFDMFMG